MNLKTYLMEWDPKRFQQARDDGLLDDPKQTERRVKTIPDWFIRDADPFENVFLIEDAIEDENGDISYYTRAREEFSDLQIKTQLLDHLKDRIEVKEGNLPYTDNRSVITKKGDIFWAPSDLSVHVQIIAYGMLVGKIPMNENFGDFRWSEPNYKEHANHFLCLEIRKNKIFLAESYFMGFNISKDIKQIVENIPKNHGYNIALRKMGYSSVQDIIFSRPAYSL